MAERGLGGVGSHTWIPYRIPDSLLAREAWGGGRWSQTSLGTRGKNTPTLSEIPA